MRRGAPIAERLQDGCVVDRETRCHNWSKGLDAGGYGQIKVKGKTQNAHRVAYRYLVGEIPAGIHVLHRCDNRRCINPLHLFLGTHAENMQDKAAKGRCGCAKGEASGSAKLTAAQVVEIRALAQNGFTQKAIGLRFGVSQVTVGDIAVRRKSWAHIGGVL